MNFRLFSLVFSFLLTTTFLKSASQLSAGTIAYEAAGAIFKLPGTIRQTYQTFQNAYHIAHCTKEELHKKMQVAILKQDSTEALYLLSIPEFDGTCYSPEEKITTLVLLLVMGKIEILEAFSKRKINLFKSLSDLPNTPNPLFLLATYSNATITVQNPELIAALTTNTIYVSFDPAKFKRALYFLTNAGFDINEPFSEWRLTPAMLVAQPLLYMKGTSAIPYLSFDVSFESLKDNATKLQIIMEHPSFNPHVVNKNGHTVSQLFQSQNKLYRMGSRLERFQEDFWI